MNSKGVIIMWNRLAKISDILGSKKGGIICIVIAFMAIGVIGGQKLYEGVEAARIEAAQDREREVEATVRAEASVYEEIHAMANSIVIADDVWSREPITMDTIDALSDEIQRASYADGKELLGILSRWKAGDFSQAAYDHNYVWGKLDGNTGRATGVNNNKLPSWAID